MFGDRSAQERVYEVCGAPLVESVLQGYNGTIFAYGQVYIALLLVDVVEDILGWWLRNAASRNQDTNALERAGGIYVQCTNIICSYVCMIPVSMYRRSIMINTYTQKSTIFFCSTWYVQSRLCRCDCLLTLEAFLLSSTSTRVCCSFRTKQYSTRYRRTLAYVQFSTVHLVYENACIYCT